MSDDKKKKPEVEPLDGEEPPPEGDQGEDEGGSTEGPGK